MFNPYKHIRLAACVSLLLAQLFSSWALIALGFILIMTGLVGGLDLAERRIELLEKLLMKENTDEKTDAN